MFGPSAAVGRALERTCVGARIAYCRVLRLSFRALRSKSLYHGLQPIRSGHVVHGQQYRWLHPDASCAAVRACSADIASPKQIASNASAGAEPARARPTQSAERNVPTPRQYLPHGKDPEALQPIRWNVYKIASKAVRAWNHREPDKTTGSRGVRRNSGLGLAG
jgi:hypothetical protein